MRITATCDHCLPTSKYSGSVVSFRSDGRDLRLYAARITATFALAFKPGTSDLFVTMNQRDDLGDRTTGDALAIVSPGTDWKFPGCYAQGGPALRRRAPSDRAAGQARRSRLRRDPHRSLGRATASTALVAEWQAAKVQRVTLTKASGGYMGSVSPWLTGLQHPLALILTRTRSVLIGDWERERSTGLRRLSPEVLSGAALATRANSAVSVIR
jgi:hypothetical protein